MFYRVWLSPLVLDVFEDTELSHDIGHSVKELLVVLTYLAFPFLVHDVIVRWMPLEHVTDVQMLSTKPLETTESARLTFFMLAGMAAQGVQFCLYFK